MPVSQEQLTVDANQSESAKTGQLIVSVRDIDMACGLRRLERAAGDSKPRVCTVIGRPGLPNVERVLRVGDAVLFETPDYGLLEIRLMAVTRSQAEYLVSRIAPTPGIAAGFVDDDPENSPFTAQETARISRSLEAVSDVVSKHPGVQPEQLDYICRKLDEMRAASERLGRKDWMLYAVGTLTSIAVTMSLNPQAATSLIQATGSALRWLYQGGVYLLT